MIHTATQGPKFLKLVRRLRPHFQGFVISEHVAAVGILERLWHTAIVGAKRGDIGRFDDVTICESIGWHGESSELIEILIDSEWLDRSDEYRLIIHDWHEHAPGFIKKNINRVGGFVTGNYKPNDSQSDDDLSNFELDIGSSEEGFEVNHAQVSHFGPTPNITQQNLTKPNNPVPGPARETGQEVTDELDWVLQTFPSLAELQQRKISPLADSDDMPSVWKGLTPKNIKTAEIVIWYRKQLSAIDPVLSGANESELCLVIASGLAANKNSKIRSPVGWFADVVRRKRWRRVGRFINQSIDILNRDDVREEIER